MTQRSVSESDVNDVMHDIVGAFQGEFGFPKLKPEAEALFRRGFEESVRAALREYRWKDKRPPSPHLPEFETWQAFIIELIRRVARSLKNEGYGTSNKVNRKALRETIVTVGKEHGCPAAPPEGEPEALGRWCSFFIQPLPAEFAGPE